MNDISNEDSIREGIAEKDHELFPKGWKDYLYSKYDTPYPSPRQSFRSLWQLINGRDSFDENPWVWVVEFKRITKEEALS